MIVVILIVAGVFGEDDEPASSDPAASSTEQTTKAETKETKSSPLSNPVLKIDDSTEPNSTERMDKIIMQAKEDAKRLDVDGATVAVTYIVDRYPDKLFESSEVMENVIYYGSLLEYWELDTVGYNEFGMDAVQAVKYVYRGVESKDDAATLENLRQMWKDMDAIVNN